MPRLEPTKRKKREVDPADIHHVNSADRFKIVEEASGGSLPTSVSVALVEHQHTEKELRRLGGEIARGLDPSPAYIFGKRDYRDYADPLYGGRLRLQTARRLSELAMADNIAGTLRNLKGLQEPITGRLRGQLLREQRGGEKVRLSKTVSVDPMLVGRYVEEMGPLAGHELTYGEALAVGVELAKKNADPTAFGNNLRFVKSWVKVGEREMSERRMASLAALAAQRGVVFRDRSDVVAFLTPALARKAAGAEHQERVAGAVAEAERKAREEPTTALGAGLGAPVVATASTDLARFGDLFDLFTNGTQDEVDAALKGQFGTSESDLFAQAQDIDRRIVFDETAFDRSPFNRFVVRPVLAVLRKVYGEEMAGLHTSHDGLLNLAATLGDNDTVDRLAQQRALESEAIREGKKSYADVLHENYGVPRGLAIGMEVLVAWYTDPLIVGGKAIQLRRLRRVFPGLAEKETLVGTLIGKIGPAPLRRAYADFRASRRLSMGEWETLSWRTSDDWIDSLTDTAIAKAQGDKDAVGKWARDFAKPKVAAQSSVDRNFFELVVDDAIKTYGIKGIRGGKARLELRQAIVAHFTWKTPEGVAGRALKRYEDELGAAGQALTREVQGAGEARIVVASELDVGRAARGEAMGEATLRGVPAFRTLRGQPFEPPPLATPGRELILPERELTIAPKELAEEVIERGTVSFGDFYRAPLRMEIPTRLKFIPFAGLGKLTLLKLEDTRLGRTALGRRTVALLNVNTGNLLKIQENPERWFRNRARRAVLVPERVRYYEREAATAGGLSRVVREKRLVDLGEAMDTEIIKRWAARHNASDEFVEKALATLKQARIEAQDDIFGVLTRTTAEGRGVVERLERPLLRTQLRKYSVFQDPIAIERALNQTLGTSRRMRNAFLRAAKGRVPEAVAAKMSAQRLTDYVLQYGAKRLLSAWKWGAVGRPAYIFRVILLDEGARSLATIGSLFERVMAQEFKGTIFGLRGKVGAKLDDLLKEKIQFGDDFYEIKRAGAYERDIRANPLYNQAKQVENWMQDTLRIEKAALARGWTLLEPGQAGYHDAWAHVLNRQLPYSDAGREALRQVVAQHPLNVARAHMREWAQSPLGRAEWRSLGRDAWDVDMWADDVADLAYTYTLGRREMARNALLHNVEVDQLRAIDKTGLPPIHGPRISYTVGDRVPKILTQPMQTWYSWWVRRPEEILNRQPFYKAWRRRSEKALAQSAADVGLPLTPELRTTIQEASKNFALAQTRKIMFDFTENSRLGELISFIAPFSQPFFENIAVWGHIILKRNPALVGYTRVLWKAGEEGFIRKDPDTGELVIPLPVIGDLSVAALGAWTVGGWQLSAPLQSFNLFFSSQFKVPSDTPLIGGVTIPIPSLAPWAQAPLQAMFENSDSESVQHWLFEYGAQPFSQAVMPTWIENAIKVAFPEAFEDQATRSRMDFLRLQQFMGQEPDPEKAKGQARAFSGFRLFASLFFPAQPRVDFPYAEQQRELNDLRETQGFEEGTDEFVRRYPDLTLLTIGKTAQDRVVVGGKVMSREQAQRLGLMDSATIPVRIPHTEAALRMMRTPGFREFARQHPLWGAAIILGSQQDEFDFPAYAAAASSGEIRVKTIEEFLQDDQEVKMWRELDMQEGAYDARFDALRAKGLSSGDEKWDALAREREFDLGLLYESYPEAAARFLVRTPQGADWQTFRKREDVVVALGVRQLLKVDDIQNFPAIKGLRFYINETDALEADMDKAGVRSLTDPGAEEEGFVERMEDIKARTIETYPEFKPFLNAYFRSHLRADRETEGERLAARLAKTDPAKYAKFNEADTHLANLRERIGEVEDQARKEAERAEDYRRLREFENHLYNTGQAWILRLRWKKLTHGEREQDLASLATRPVFFMSRFDLELLNVKLTDKAAGWLGTINEIEVRRQRFKEANPGESTADFFEERDTFIRQRLGKDRTFDKVIGMNFTWGSQLEALGYTKGDTQAAWSWRQVVALANRVRKEWEGQDIHGYERLGEFDPDKRATAERHQDIVADYVDELRENPEFNRQWDYLERRTRVDLLDYIIPPIWFWLRGA